MIDGLLARADSTAPERDAERLRAFRRFVLLYGAVRSWLWLPFLSLPAALPDPGVITASALWLSACAALAWSPRHGAWAPRLALPVLLLEGWQTFPITDNHFFVEGLCVALLALVDRDDRDSEILIARSLRWLCVIVLFQTGVQKLLYGHYLHGDFLAYMAGTDPRFAALLGPVLGGEALATLQRAAAEGASFRVASLPLRIASNGVMLAELVVPWLLLLPRTRVPAVAAAILLVLAIQSGAREFGFAILFVNVTLLFTEANWNRRLLPLFALLFAVALAFAYGLVPGRGLSPGFL